MPKLKVLLNVGLDDQRKYGIPNGPNSDEPPMENDVIEVDDKIADIMVNRLKLAKLYDAKEEREHQERVAKEDAKRRDQFEAMREDPAHRPAPRSENFARLDPPRTEGTAPAASTRPAKDK